MAFPEQLKALAQKQVQAQRQLALQKQAAQKAAASQQMLRAEQHARAMPVHQPAPPRQQPAPGLQQIAPTGQPLGLRKPNALGTSRYDALATDWNSDENLLRLRAAGESAEASAQAYKDYAAKRWGELKQGPRGAAARAQDKELTWTERAAASAGMGMPLAEDAVNLLAPRSDVWHRIVTGQATKDDYIDGGLDVVGLVPFAGWGIKAAGKSLRATRAANGARTTSGVRVVGDRVVTPDGQSIPLRLLDDTTPKVEAVGGLRGSSAATGEAAGSRATTTVGADAAEEAAEKAATTLSQADEIRYLRAEKKATKRGIDMPSRDEFMTLQEKFAPVRKETYKPFPLRAEKPLSDSRIRTWLENKRMNKLDRLHERYPVVADGPAAPGRTLRNQSKYTRLDSGRLNKPARYTRNVAIAAAVPAGAATYDFLATDAGLSAPGLYGMAAAPDRAKGLIMGAALALAEKERAYVEQKRREEAELMALLYGGGGGYYTGGGGGAAGMAAQIRKSQTDSSVSIPRTYDGLYVSK